MSNTKKPPFMANGEAHRVINSVSKSALLDMVVDMLRQQAGNEELNGSDLVVAFCDRFEPVALLRGDRMPKRCKVRKK